MREIVLDTETTGLNPLNGDRVIEIGCVELSNHLPTGNTYHQYINPERDIPSSAFEVHGLSADFLKSYPIFSDIIDNFKKFIDGATLIIHNAKFDIGFLNAEIARLGQPLLSVDDCVDTVKLAREKYPFAPASLNALCKRFKIDNSNRELHGALLDAELLAEVYLQLIGGQQPDLSLLNKSKEKPVLFYDETKNKKIRIPREHLITKDELDAHRKFISTLENPIWFNKDTKKKSTF
tara:strand:- start:508 stop:1215 length:708 start_codon:yes stop_codon:yes gene_type:complete